VKILFINKYDTTGGAGVAAWRLSEGLRRQYATQNHFIVGIKRSHHASVQPIAKNQGELFIQRGTNALMNLLGLQYHYVPFSSRRIIEYAHRFQPDIISLHNVHGGYFPISLLKPLSMMAPIVWTLHDMWAFTANAAHTFGDESWKQVRAGNDEHQHFPAIGLQTGNWLLRRKEKIYRDSYFAVVTPSQWLYQLAIQSPLFVNKQIVQIPNGINLETFRPLDRISVRKKFDIPVEAKVLFFSSEDLRRDDFKGGSLLIDILQKIHEKIHDPLHVVIIGGGSIEGLRRFPKFIIRQTGFIDTEENMVEIMNVGDVLVYPSRADNLPNVLIESIACGVPAVTYDTGGCKEIIQHAINGFVVPQFDASQFAERVIDLLKTPHTMVSFSHAARETAKKKFDIRTTAQQYYSLFKELAG
jgi:glycosyltransferase involved in cell wall biosynthesis